MTESVFEEIKKAGEGNKVLKLKLSKPILSIPMKLADKKAIHVIEQLMDDPDLEKMTFKEMHEIFDFAKFYLEFFQIMWCQKGIPEEAEP